MNEGKGAMSLKKNVYIKRGSNGVECIRMQYNERNWR